MKLQILLLSALLTLAACQKSTVGGSLGTGGGSGNGAAGSPGADVPPCPSGGDTCAYATWTDSSIGDPNVGDILYSLFYGTSSGVYTTEIDGISNTYYQVTNLQPGTYYFAVTAYNANGASPYSAEASKTITLQQLSLNPLAKVSGTGVFTIPPR